MHNPHVEDAIEDLNRARPALETLVGESDLLASRHRRDALRYLDGFYEIANNRTEVERQILGRCR
jgi:hypothetical protein